MGADITIKQNGTNLEFNKIDNRPGEVYMHPRNISHHPTYIRPPYGENTKNQSHYRGEIDIPSQIKDKKGKLYKVTELGQPDKPVMEQALQLMTVSIPGTVKKIFPYAFAGCNGLRMLNLHEGIEELQHHSFYFCEQLIRVVIPNSVVRMADAFIHCTNLQEVEIGSGMCRMDGDFKECNLIQRVTCKADKPPKVKHYPFSDNVYSSAVLFVPLGSYHLYKDDSAWKRFERICPIPDFGTVNFVSDGIRYELTRFRYMTDDYEEAHVVGVEDVSQKKEIYLGTVRGFAVTRIKDCAFQDVEVTKIWLPSTVNEIGSYAFKGSGITTFNIPFAVKEIKECTLMGCPLKEIDIPANIVSIGDSAFKGCDRLEIVKMHDGLKKIGAYAFSENHALHELTIPDTVEEIGCNAFADAELSHITLNNNLKSIENGVFFGNPLKEVFIPAGPYINNIGEKAFAGNQNNLQTITCMKTPPPDITENAFDADTYEKAELKVPAHALNLYQAHEVWGKFRIIFGVGSSQSSSTAVGTGDSFVFDYIRYEVKDANAKIVHVARIPDNYKDMLEHRSHDCGVVNMMIPPRVKYKGEEYTVKGINDEAAGEDGIGIGVLEIPSTVETIGKKAFYKCVNMKGLILHDGLLRIGESAFEGGIAFRNSFTLQLPNTLQEIGKKAFYESCIDGELKIPDSVTYIGESAFDDTCLEKVTFGKGITKIEAYAFFDLSHMKELFIPDWITYIGAGAFYENEDVLKKVTCMATTPPVMGLSAFADETYQSAELFVPSSALQAYQDDLAWQQFAKITGIDDGLTLPPLKPVCTGDYINVNGIRYYVRDAEARVVYVAQPDYDRKYYNKIVIPATVEYHGVTYWVKKVSENAFRSCKNLQRVTLPASIDEIKENAFCEIPGSIVIECLAATPPLVAKNAIPKDKEWRKKVYITVPKSSVDLYKKDSNWKGFGAYFTIDIQDQPTPPATDDQPTPPVVIDTGNNVEVDGIRYWIKDAAAKIAYVTNLPKGRSYSGEVVIPSTVQIGGDTYQVKKVGNYTFSHCNSLTAVTLPASIEEVKDMAFEGSTDVKTVTCLATTPPALGKNAVTDMAPRATLVVPQSSVDKYANAEGWKSFLKIEGQ